MHLAKQHNYMHWHACIRILVYLLSSCIILIIDHDWMNSLQTMITVDSLKILPLPKRQYNYYYTYLYAS